jgi:nucleoside-diphosphate-sugar epimerase
LRADKHEVVAAVRKSTGNADFEHGPLGANTDWSAALHGSKVVVHLAARVHQMHESRGAASRAYREMNVGVTLNLAQQAISAGVARFVFVSSVKVNGETSGAHPFTAMDVPAPEDAYGLSKWEAEQGLQELGAKSGMEVVIVRPPLVYGPGVRANFLRLMSAVHAGMPLPLAMVRSPRSLVALDNLADFLSVCTTHPRAAGKVWMVSDQHDVSIAGLIRLIAAAMGRPARLLPVPPALLAGMAIMLGKRAAATRILDALQVDSRPASELLNWSPAVSLEEGIRRTVDDFLARLKS